jgi:RsiW-degrading membrane proteinase PrsW (M82 family)
MVGESPEVPHVLHGLRCPACCGWAACRACGAFTDPAIPVLPPPRPSKEAGAGFFLAFLLGPLGLFLCLHAFRRCARSGGRLKGGALALLGLVVATIWLFLGLLLLQRKAIPGSNPLALGALATLCAGAGWLMLVRHYDRAEPEPLKELLGVGLRGGAMSAVLALVCNTLVLGLGPLAFRGHSLPPAAGFVPALFVGLSEEFWKMTATRALIWRRANFNEPVDALIYGLTVALGFATFENLLYLLTTGPFSISRNLICTPAHLGFAALWAQGFAVAKFRKGARSPFPTLIPYWLLAALAHGLYDGVLFARLPHASWISILLMVVLVLWTANRLLYLEARSPFLAPGQCSGCECRNGREAKYCARCGAAFALRME